MTLKIKLKSYGLAKKYNWFEVEWNLAAHILWGWREVESVYHHKVISLLFSWAFCQDSEIVFWHDWPLCKWLTNAIPVCVSCTYMEDRFWLWFYVKFIYNRVDEKYNCTWCSCLMVLCLLPDSFLHCHFPMQGLCLRSSTMLWLRTACYVFAVSFFWQLA